jgi:hypothetical protein
MECVPAASAEVVRDAVPAFKVTVPSEVVPSRMRTVPVGVLLETLPVKRTSTQ